MNCGVLNLEPGNIKPTDSRNTINILSVVAINANILSNVPKSIPSRLASL